VVVAVIPARYGSTRFPGKPLVDIRGKSMIQRVWERTQAAPAVGRVVVATDDERIAEHVRAFGGEVMLTRADHRSGTDRCAEVAAQLPEAEVVLNVQGDEPFVHPEQIELLVQTLREHPDCAVATLAKRIEQAHELFSPHVVKVVFSAQQRALYFSRQPIPYVRQTPSEEWIETTAFYKHLGLYAFQRATLLQLAQLPPSALERAESLEQLRWLESGHSIAVGLTTLDTVGIDTPEDLERLLVYLPDEEDL